MTKSEPMNTDDTIKIRAIDLFCGAGGSSWGAYEAGIAIVAGFDKWVLAGEDYNDNFPSAKFYNSDLDSVDPKELTGKIGNIDLILASPECTNHSPAKGAVPRCEKSRETAFHIVRFAKEFQPRWLVVENVINMRRWHRFEEFVNCLTTLGYHHRAEVLIASDFGVPQSRKRLFLLFDRQNKPPTIPPAIKTAKNIKTCISPNGRYRFTPLRTERRAKATLERADRAISSLGEGIPFLIVYYGSDGAGGWQSLDRPLRTITTLDRFAYVKPTEDDHAMRMLQPEELKLAMGWPKKYRIERGTRRDKIRLIGNAVCPAVMRAVVSHLTANG